jgi:hypothetical protein
MYKQYDTSVGSSKKKLIKLLILLAFLCRAFYVFKTLEYKDECLGLIEQNRKLIGRNMDVISVNNKLMDNNNYLLSKISDMEILLITKDSLLLQSNKRSVVENNQSMDISMRENMGYTC